MIVLDTNVVSELMRHDPEPRVIAWLDGQSGSGIYLSAVSAAELRYGAARLPRGRRRNAINRAVDELLRQEFAGRILPFDARAAEHYADIVAVRESRGVPIGMADGQIASICRSNDAGLATRNTQDFVDTGLTIIDPWRNRRA